MLNNKNNTTMRKMMITLTVMLLTAVTAQAMSYEQARNEALFLTDKMAYELNLTDAQYEAAYEINLDYLMGVASYDDVFGTYWERRNMDLSYILLDWQWKAFCAATYFYRPLYWSNGYWHFGIYARYPHRDYFFFGRPAFYATYRGGHAWHVVGGRGYYHNHHSHYRPVAGRSHFGMLDRWNRGDYNRGHHRNYDNRRNNGYNNRRDNGYDNRRDNGYNNRRDNGYSNRRDNGYDNRRDNNGNNDRRQSTGSGSLGSYRSSGSNSSSSTNNSSSAGSFERNRGNRSFDSNLGSRRINSSASSRAIERSVNSASTVSNNSRSAGSFSRSSGSFGSSRSGGSISRGSGASHSSSGAGRSSSGGHSYGGRR